MKATSYTDWHPNLLDPTGKRSSKPRTIGKTMIIDKGIGLRAFEDLLQTAGDYIDMIKIGFGTSPLYPKQLLQKKISLAKEHNILIYPGGTFLEVAVVQDAVRSFFQSIHELGFDGVEVSDGTIEISREVRNQLITQGKAEGLQVITEYGKKCWGSRIEIEELKNTLYRDIEFGASLVTIEGRESGAGVGIYDEHGACMDRDVEEVLQTIPDSGLILWEAPKKSQQVHLLKMLGPEINLGNVAPEEILSLECLRRGLRSDTFLFPEK